MSDINTVINKILSDDKLINSKAFSDRIYKDEPIIRTASQLKKAPSPSKIKEMKNLAFTPEAYWKTSAWLFYTQGKFMEDYTDSFSFSEDFVKYYPSYRDMTVEQLRGYFTWRTNARKGMIEKAPLPFAFMYMYELINCIGADTAEKCFYLLRDFCTEYVKSDPSISKYSNKWLLDFIVYYGLDPALAAELSDIRYDAALITLMNYESHTSEEIYDALSGLSAYQPERSLFCTAYPEDFKKVLVQSYIKLSDYFAANRKNTLFQKLFGCITECSHHMFESALFYDRHPLRCCEYSLNEIHTYSCRNGKWSCKRFYGNRSRNGHLGNFVRAVDSIMREKTDFRHKIAFEAVSKNAVKIIQAETDRYYSLKELEQAKKIEIDLSQLNRIRSASDKTREKLLVDDEETISVPEPVRTAEPPADEADSECPLDKNEMAFLHALLYNGDPSAAAKSCGSLMSVLADSVNDKLFESFCDTVIDYSADFPELIEDYVPQLKEMIPKE